MRRKEKQIQQQADLEAIISRAEVCRLALSVDNRPYIVPLCFGYESGILYFHSAKEGKKLEMIKANPQVCFELEIAIETVKASEACRWGLKYQSIIGFGKASFIQDMQGKNRALDIIMNQYSDGKWEYQQKLLDKTVVFKVEIDEMTGKKSGD